MSAPWRVPCGPGRPWKQEGPSWDPGHTFAGPPNEYCHPNSVSWFAIRHGVGGILVITVRRLLASAVALTALALTGPAAAVTIQFDYAFDGGFFAQQGRRDLLQAAGDYVGDRLTDSLTAIESGGGNTFAPNFSDPVLSGSRQLDARSIPEKTLVIYTGGRALPSQVAGSGGPGGFDISYVSEEWKDNAFNRGQAGDTGFSSTSTDVGPWGGAVWFGTGINWHFDADPLSVESFSGIDFFSVAIHEIAHVLGFGTAASWNHWTDTENHEFSGPAAVAAHGGNVPLEEDNAHWLNGTGSTVAGVGQETAMDPIISSGDRKFFTALDWAALADIGWEVQAIDEVEGVPSPVPLPASAWLMLAALAGLGMVGRRRTGSLAAA